MVPLPPATGLGRIAAARLRLGLRAGRQAAVDEVWRVWLGRLDPPREDDWLELLLRVGRPASALNPLRSRVVLGRMDVDMVQVFFPYLLEDLEQERPRIGRLLRSARHDSLTGAQVEAGGAFWSYTSTDWCNATRPKAYLLAADRACATVLSHGLHVPEHMRARWSQLGDAPTPGFADDQMWRTEMRVLQGRVEDWAGADAYGSELARAYRRADAELKRRLREELAARGGNRGADLLRMVTGGGTTDFVPAPERRPTGAGRSLTGITRREVEFLVGELGHRGEWAGLWRLARDLPLCQAVAAVRAFPPDWVPSESAGQRRLFELLVGADPVGVERAARLLSAARRGWVPVSGKRVVVASVSVSSDGSRAVVEEAWPGDPKKGTPSRSVLAEYALPSGLRLSGVYELPGPGRWIAAAHTGGAVVGGIGQAGGVVPVRCRDGVVTPIRVSGPDLGAERPMGGPPDVGAPVDGDGRGPQPTVADRASPTPASAAQAMAVRGDGSLLVAVAAPDGGSRILIASAAELAAPAVEGSVAPNWFGRPLRDDIPAPVTAIDAPAWTDLVAVDTDAGPCLVDLSGEGTVIGPMASDSDGCGGTDGTGGTVRFGTDGKDRVDPAPRDRLPAWSGRRTVHLLGRDTVLTAYPVAGPPSTGGQQRGKPTLELRVWRVREGRLRPTNVRQVPDPDPLPIAVVMPGGGGSAGGRPAVVVPQRHGEGGPEVLGVGLRWRGSVALPVPGHGRQLLAVAAVDGSGQPRALLTAGGVEFPGPYLVGVREVLGLPMAEVTRSRLAELDAVVADLPTLPEGVAGLLRLLRDCVSTRIPGA